MIDIYYQRALTHLRELASEFAQSHPALGSMLSGPGTDPDVERLLEGTAFLSGLIDQKLEDEFPEVVHGLMQLIFPHYLRPIPSSTIIKFTPKLSLLEHFKIPAGTQINSIPIEDTPCTFTTTYDVDLYPLVISAVTYTQHVGNTATLKIDMQLKGIQLKDWDISSLRFHLVGSVGQAADRYHILMKKTRSVAVASESGIVTMLGSDCIREVGYADDESLLPYPSQSLPGYRILQEYFILPEKFLFFDITGLERWTQRGTSDNFSFIFEFDELSSTSLKFSEKDICLFAAPAINLFAHEADPIILNHKKPEYRIIPSNKNSDNFQVYSVDKVVGFAQGSVDGREYMPFHMFNLQVTNSPIYNVHYRRSSIHNLVDIFLSIAYSSTNENIKRETLSIALTCSNSNLPTKLRYGDICKATATSPELATFENIRQPTAPVQPPLGRDVLWRLLSHLYINYLSLADIDSLRAMAKLYIFSDTPDKSSVVANSKRVDAITDINISEKDRIVRGLLMRGREINLAVNRDGFASEGDLFLFCSVLNRLFAGYSSINSFTQLKVEEVVSKETYIWKAMIGDRPLM
ncbi:type VI secretion system baseplate subunit TssF [Celerinatantimonas sp. MCCC 1A17872]|uniref:type VI secretion system baseplate subunit TssF n=1 Tax=Celerinatantimonas sp. MCCC 1A17872 TaxID=3177514 RepID=UPI0038BEC2D0